MAPPLVVASLLRRAKYNVMDGSVVRMDAGVHVDYARVSPSAGKTDAAGWWEAPALALMRMDIAMEIRLSTVQTVLWWLYHAQMTKCAPTTPPLSGMHVNQPHVHPTAQRPPILEVRRTDAGESVHLQHRVKTLLRQACVQVASLTTVEMTW